MRNWDTDRPRQRAGRRRRRRPRSSSPTPCRRSSRASCSSPSRPKPEEYEHRQAGIQAHNRWLADFCAEKPERARRHRPDLPQRRRRRHRRRARGSRRTACAAACSSARAPDLRLAQAALRPRTTTRCGRAARSSRSPVNSHGGTGGPATSRPRPCRCVHIREIAFYSQRPLAYMILGGVFERFPNLKFVITEAGLRLDPAVLDQLDRPDGEHAHGRGRRDALSEARSCRRSRPPSTSSRTATSASASPGPLDMPPPRRPGRHRPGHVGQRLPPRRGHLPVHPRAPPPGHRPGSRPSRSSRSWPATPRSSTASTSPRCSRRPISSAHTVAEVGEPLTELPDDPNQALVKAARQLAKAS